MVQMQKEDVGSDRFGRLGSCKDKHKLPIMGSG